MLDSPSAHEEIPRQEAIQRGTARSGFIEPVDQASVTGIQNSDEPLHRRTQHNEASTIMRGIKCP